MKGFIRFMRGAGAFAGTQLYLAVLPFLPEKLINWLSRGQTTTPPGQDTERK